MRIIQRGIIALIALFISTYTSITTFAQIGPIILGPNNKPLPAQQPLSTPITLEEAIQILQTNNKAILIADKSIEIARAEKQKLNSMWYPYITATGTYMHFSNDIEVKENLGEILKPLFPHLNPQQISGIISGIEGVLNGITFSFPILQQNISTIDAAASWPLFTGGKRIYANRIGKAMISSAEEMKNLVTFGQIAILTETYYTLKLSQEVVAENQESVETMTLLFNNAMSLMRNGMINKAEMLVAQVALEESIRELENARERVNLAENALKTVMGVTQISNTSTPINNNTSPLLPTTNFQIIDPLPPIEYYRDLITNNNTQLKLLKEQQNIALNEKKIAISGYMPNIALFAKQTLYSYQIPSNLAPRTVIGAGMVWNIFDGLNREKNIQISNKTYQQLLITEEKAQADLFLLADKLRSQMMDALYNIRALKSTTELCTELLAMREKSFAEGMATSFDVVQARTTLSKAKLATLFAYWQFNVALANMNTCTR